MYWVLRVAYKLFMLLHRGSNAVSVLLKTDFRYSYVFVFKVDPRVGHTTLTHSHNCPQRSERSSPPNIRTSRPTTHTHHIHVVCDLHMKFYLIKHFTTRSELKKGGTSLCGLSSHNSTKTNLCSHTVSKGIIPEMVERSDVCDKTETKAHNLFVNSLSTGFLHTFHSALYIWYSTDAKAPTTSWGSRF